MKKDKLQPHLQHAQDIENESLYAASTQECTGLTPTPFDNEFEAEAYQQLFHFIPPYGPINSCSAVDDPIPPFNYGVHATDTAPKSRHDYP